MNKTEKANAERRRKHLEDRNYARELSDVRRMGAVPGPYIVRHRHTGAEWRLEDLSVTEDGRRIWVPRHGRQSARVDKERIGYEIVGPLPARTALLMEGLDEIQMGDDRPPMSTGEPLLPRAILTKGALLMASSLDGYYPALPVSWERWGVFHLVTAGGDRVWSAEHNGSVLSYNDGQMLGARVGRRLRMPGER